MVDIADAINISINKIRVREPYIHKVIAVLFVIWALSFLVFSNTSFAALPENKIMAAVLVLVILTFFIILYYYFSKQLELVVEDESVLVKQRWTKKEEYKIFKNNINSIIINKPLLKRMAMWTPPATYDPYKRTPLFNFWLRPHRPMFHEQGAFDYPLIFQLHDGSKIKFYITQNSIPYFEAEIQKFGFPLVAEKKVIF